MNWWTTTRLERRKERFKQRKINQKLKRRLFGHLVMSPCCYCKQVFLINQLTIEHIVPLVMAGTNDDDNIALACAPCNRQKGKEVCAEKRKLNKEFYEKHYPQYYKQNRQRTL